MHRISIDDDTIDTRDVLVRIDELDADETEELAMWSELLGKAVACSEDSAEDGIQLIADRYFVAYTREFAEDCYNMPDTWPFRCIDWAQAARELQMDYSSITVDGAEFWVR